MNLFQAKTDLDIAAREMSRMASATDIKTFYESWQNFLIRIARAWELAERALRKQKGFQQWFKPYKEQRETDPLLKYLRAARNAETHAVSPTIDKPFILSLRDKLGRPFQIEKITTTFKDGVLRINVDTPAQDHFLDFEAPLVPTKPELTRFMNRGKWYDPPESHLGNSIKDIHPVFAASLGLSFYKSFIHEAEYKFAKKS